MLVTRITNDDFDWDLEAGGTPSANTGPSDDVTIGGLYMYTEASNPRDDGDFAIIYSESIDISGLNNPKVKFLQPYVWFSNWRNTN